MFFEQHNRESATLAFPYYVYKTGNQEGSYYPDAPMQRHATKLHTGPESLIQDSSPAAPSSLLVDQERKKKKKKGRWGSWFIISHTWGAVMVISDSNWLLNNTSEAKNDNFLTPASAARAIKKNKSMILIWWDSVGTELHWKYVPHAYKEKGIWFRFHTVCVWLITMRTQGQIQKWDESFKWALKLSNVTWTRNMHRMWIVLYNTDDQLHNTVCRLLYCAFLLDVYLGNVCWSLYVSQ